MNPRRRRVNGPRPLLLLALLLLPAFHLTAAPDRLRLIIETDAGGDPDDEQSLVRFLLYTCEWDVEGIIANRPHARDGENRNPERTGAGIVRRLIDAYAACHPNLLLHDARYPTPETLRTRTVPGANHVDDGVQLLIEAIDRPDPRPVWYSDWGTDHGAATNNLRRALDRILKERGPDGYARFKARLRLASADAFGDHTARLAPPFPLWVDTWRPALDGQRWYHRFSDLTATAGGFDLQRDLLRDHGPLGALYPTNTTHRQKEGDSLSFIYLIPTGLNDPSQPGWGGWGGRLAPNPNFPGHAYYWASVADSWNGTAHRDNTLRRWAADIQNDFRARLDWCVQPPSAANHPPRPIVNGTAASSIRRVPARPGATLEFDAGRSTDPDGNALTFEWFIYREAGDYAGDISLAGTDTPRARVTFPANAPPGTAHLVLRVADSGSPPLAAYRRFLITLPAATQN